MPSFIPAGPGPGPFPCTGTCIRHEVSEDHDPAFTIISIISTKTHSAYLDASGGPQSKSRHDWQACWGALVQLRPPPQLTSNSSSSMPQLSSMHAVLQLCHEELLHGTTALQSSLEALISTASLGLLALLRTIVAICPNGVAYLKHSMDVRDPPAFFQEGAAHQWQSPHDSARKTPLHAVGTLQTCFLHLQSIQQQSTLGALEQRHTTRCCGGRAKILLEVW